MKVNLIIRQCDRCGHKAVPLDGEGTDCIECPGEYGEKTDTKTVDVPVTTALGFKKTNPEAFE